MINVLVTGAGGQLGKTIEELYKENDLDIEFTFLDKSNFDITDKSQINQIFNKQKFDYCINCAAYTNVDQAEKTKQGAHEINAEGVKNLALVCKARNHIDIFTRKQKSYLFSASFKYEMASQKCHSNVFR
jgi:dTDP-4-dehydrorhamnose reductase